MNVLRAHVYNVTMIECHVWLCECSLLWVTLFPTHVNTPWRLRRYIPTYRMFERVCSKHDLFD